MTRLICLLSLMSLWACSTNLRPGLLSAGGNVEMFNGQNLDGWEGDPTYWRVEDGVMIGEITPETVVDRNTFLIWRGGRPANFDLKVEYRLSPGGNSGINYRSEEVAGIPNALRGYQADMDYEHNYSGMNYEERGRTTIARRGERVVLPPVSTGDLDAHIENNRWTAREVVASLGDAEELKAFVNDDDWNEYHIVARGNRLRHYINGVLMSEVTDEDPTHRRMDGLIGVQVHVGPPMKVEFRNWQLTETDAR